jgi:large subunit ribosomal protein L32
MPNPRRRHSRGRGKRRRTHWKVAPVALAGCPQCKSPKMPHRVCLVCGYYDGRLVVDFEAKKVKKEAKKKKQKGQ